MNNQRTLEEIISLNRGMLATGITGQEKARLAIMREIRILAVHLNSYCLTGDKEFIDSMFYHLCTLEEEHDTYTALSINKDGQKFEDSYTRNQLALMLRKLIE